MEKYRTKTVLSTLFSAFMLVGMLALAAQADVAGVLVFSGGEAVIGVETIDELEKNGCIKYDDNGMNAPVTFLEQDGSTPTTPTFQGQKFRCYAFEAGDGLPGDCLAVSVDSQLLPGGCSIEAHGNVTGFCGNSTGYDGWGIITVNNGENVHLKDIGWLTSVGGVFVATATVGKDNDPQTGVFVALVQATGFNNNAPNLAQACFVTNGADAFQVNGVGVLLDPVQPFQLG